MPREETTRPRAAGFGAGLAWLALAWGVAQLVVADLLFLLGVSLSAWQAPAGLALALLAGWLWWNHQDSRLAAPGRFLALVAGFLALVAACLVLAGVFWDFSYDGQNYHMDGILSLWEGWNPLRAPYPPGFTYMLWHYPKAPWLLAGGILALTGDIELGKLYNFLFFAAAFLMCLRFYARLGLQGRAVRLALALLTALSPTVLTELYCYYVDGLLYSLFLMVAIASLEYLLFEDRGALAPLVLALLLLINVKFTGAVFATLLTLGFWLYLWRRRPSPPRPYAKAALAGLVLGGLVLGCNPYVLNTVNFLSPVYPMPFKNVAIYQAPPDLMARDRVTKLLWSHFATTSYNLRAMPKLKWPFTVKVAELEHMGSSSLRWGGMGPLFGGGVCLLVVGMALAWRRDRRRFRGGLWLSGLLLFTILVVSETWYSRFVPQVWLLAVVWLVLFCLAGGRLGWLGLALGGVLAVNQGLFLYANLQHWTESQAALACQIAEMQASAGRGMVEVKGEWRSHRHRLERAGVHLKWVPELSCAEPYRLWGSDSSTWFCLPPGPGQAAEAERLNRCLPEWARPDSPKFNPYR